MNQITTFFPLSLERKLSTFYMLCCCVCLLGISNKLSAQGQLVSLELDRVPIRSAIDVLESQTPYTFIFNVKDVVLDRAVSISAHQQPIENVLNQFFQGTKTAYHFEGSKIILHDINNPITYRQQQLELTGTVLDETGTPLPGVTVAIRGSSTGVTTDFDGNYRLSIPSGEVTLVFSYVGMTTHVVKVHNQSVLDVIMSPIADPLEEVLVTGYRNVTEKRKTGAIEKIEEETLRKYTAGTTVELIEAVVPGLLVRNTPQGPDISIRGKSTLQGSSTPLVVLNGFPMGNSFNWDLINPEDIKSVTVLKDAEAAALYGLRSANGVIVIETYDGSSASLDRLDATYRYDVFYGLNKPDLSDHQLMNSDQMIDFYLDGYQNGAVHLSLLTGGFYDVLGDIIRRRDETEELSDGQAQVLINQLRQNDATQQFSDFFLQNEFNQRHNFTIAGRSEHAYFHLTTTAQDDRSFHTNNKRTAILVNARMGMQNLFTSNLNMDMEIRTNFVDHEQNHMGYDSFYAQMPYDNIVDEEGNYLPQYNRGALVPMHEYDLFHDLGYLDMSFNRLKEFESKDIQTTTNQSLVNAALNYRLTPKIRLKTQYQYDKRSDLTENWMGLDNYLLRGRINRFTQYVPGQGLIHHIPKNPALFKNTLENTSWLWRNSVFFDVWIKKKGFLQGTIGGELQKAESHRTEDFIYGLNPKTLVQQTIDSRTLHEVGVPGYRTVYGANTLEDGYFPQHREYINDRRGISYFANLRFHWDERYSLSGTLRQDRTNFFGTDPENRRATFWSVATGWTLSNEPFLKSVSWLDYLRLRASYGFNGNVGPSQEGELFIARYGINPDPSTNGEYVLFPQSLPNPHLRWERVSTTNFGINYRVFKHISGSLEFYNRRALDLYTLEEVDPTLSVESARRIGINRGEISNSGIEFSADFRLIDNDRFSWTTDFSFSYQFGRVIETNNPSLVELATESSGIYVNGNPVDGLYVYRFEGLSENGLAQYRNKDGTIFEDLDGGVYSVESNNAEQYLAGVHSPRYFGGLGNTFRYKGFSLGVRFSYKLGHILRGPIGGTRLQYGWSSLSLSPGWNQRIQNRWRQPGDEAHTNIPRIHNFAYNATYRRFGLSDANIDKADFVRLLFVNVGYDFSPDKLERTPLTQLQLKLQVDNPWIWVANRWGIDPEYHGDNTFFGIEHANPPPKLTLSVNARF